MATKRIIDTFKLGFPWQTLDPFLFCVYHKDDYPKGEANMAPHPSHLRGRSIGSDFGPTQSWRMYHGDTIPGFPSHPHRGFETITATTNGLIDHCDSLGGTARYGDGDVQWMTAGKGIQHSEMFPLLKSDSPNPLEFFQIWLNLPAKSKFVDPFFTMIWSESVPRQTSSDGKARIRIMADQGKTFVDTIPSPPPQSWGSEQGSEVAIVSIDLDEGGTYDLPASSAGLNRRIYFYEGTTVFLDGEKLNKGFGATLKSDEAVKIVSEGGLNRLLMFQGRPIGEPVAQRGPFVMNTQTEILQAFADYSKTEFGGWPWDKSDPTLPREEGRVAKHPNGKIERPSSVQ